MKAQKKNFGLRTLTLISLLGVLLFAGIGMTGAAAQSSIPGDALYPVKTTIEQTRLSLAQDAGDRAQMKMSFAKQRLDEISALIQEGRYREINAAVLAFEANINGAILELETVSKGDPARSARLAVDITSALTRFAQTLTALAVSAPESVRLEVSRALDSTQLAGSLNLSSQDDNSSINGNDNGDDNANMNDNGDDNGNDNASINDNLNDNGDDNGNDNASINDNLNDNGDDNGNDNASINDNLNDNSDDNGNDNTSINDNSNDDNGNDNTSINDNSNDDKGGGGNDNGGGGKDNGGGNSNDDKGGGKSGKGG